MGQISDRYQFRTPNTFDGDDPARVSNARAHDENWSRLEERFNALPINPAYLIMRGTSDVYTDVPGNTDTPIMLPSTAFYNIGFDTTDTTFSTDVPGWYDVKIGLTWIGGFTAALRRVRALVSGNVAGYEDFDTTTLIASTFTVNPERTTASVVLPAAPELNQRTTFQFDTQNFTATDSPESLTVRFISAFWIRPLLDDEKRSTAIAAVT